MLAEERRIRILQMLEEKNAVQLGELATLFRVSTETVRRDLLALEKQGRLQRTHGGAISMSRMAPDHILTTRIGEHQDLKIELSQRAAQLVHEGETLALDSGSTSAEFAKVLAQRFHELTVLTHSLDVVQALRRAPGIRIILCGWKPRPGRGTPCPRAAVPRRRGSAAPIGRFLPLNRRRRRV